ncbi:NitT/TauT family transport system ATP-binding protein [Albimonas donghaensis]|uniref:NitT/TauT family transport system ATP-binding protein n=1 Tax=Albimonas donghaensis TaxID=356660 RepID=A0A1H3DRC7_9RHOB|nr:ABC transporter ATP-binding protein [Albimonas donghaensis]SDX68897.1 NitT/TauT family transport system ATP-binding protein [Albimonas donghaensis]
MRTAAAFATPVTPASAAAPAPHARLEGVTRVYPARSGGDEVHALGPISFDLRQGEFFSVVGPSGCGKSTLLDVLSGLAKPTEGTVTFEGAPVDGKVPDGVGVVFQEDASFPWLSVEDNVAFGLRRAGTDAAETRRRVEFAIGFMGLRDFRRAYPSQLSGGMRQRVCIARTLVMQPRLILLDEPFGALDQQTRLLMGDELLRLWRETGATVMLITHALDEANLLSDRIGVMSARPGRFIEVVETGWDRERDSSLAERSEFGAVTSRLWSLLRGESLRAMGQGQAAEKRA